jgi:protein-disulfide isomerase
LLALGLLVVVMYRQLGRVLGQARPAALGPPVGSNAAGFAYARAGDQAVRQFTPGNGQAALVAFVDPTCPSCEQLVTALGTAEQAGELAGLRVLLLMSDPPSYLRISDAFRSTCLEVGQAVARADLQAYSASATPLLVAIDGAGVVRSAGPAAQLADVRAAIRACLLAPSDGGTPGRAQGARIAAPPEPASQVNAAE